MDLAARVGATFLNNLIEKNCRYEKGHQNPCVQTSCDLKTSYLFTYDSSNRSNKGRSLFAEKHRLTMCQVDYF